jgi:hypothetical protein
VVAGAVLLLAVCLAVLLYRPGGDEPVTAVVTLDGAEILRIDLSKVTERTEYPVDCPYPLVIAAEPGRVCIEESDCPGKDCVHAGWISAPGRTLVCLPNRLVVTLQAGQTEVDAVTG